MPHQRLDRELLLVRPLAERENRVSVENGMVSPDSPTSLPAASLPLVEDTARRILSARDSDKSVMLTFGAHTIKNGLGPVLIELMEKGWVTHLATNGAGIIHDWELAYLGETSENVEENVAVGQFGIWHETGKYLNLAISVGSCDGLGYGESVGRMIAEGGLDILSQESLRKIAVERLDDIPEDCAAAADLLETVKRFNLPPGPMAIAHKHPEISVQAAAWRLGVPFTAHPMIGHDIIYTHPMNRGAAIGRTAMRDFLSFAQSVHGLDDGVYMSVGSAVMSPMIFEKSLSMSQNLRIQEGDAMESHYMLVVDLAAPPTQWGDGEPDKSDPAYYLRFCKTFSRMGGTMEYLSADNRDFLLALLATLRSSS